MSTTRGDHRRLEVALTDGVLTVRLNRPEVLNALDAEMTQELTDVLRRADDDDGVSAVLLTGNGRGFCAGADVGVLAEASGGGADVAPARIRRLLRQGPIRLASALWELDKPVVAAVNGPCAGAGVAIALACDVVLAAEDAAFSVVFARRGLVPDYGLTYLLPRLVGLRAAKELCLLGEKVTAARAAELGLVTEVVPSAELMERALEVGCQLARGPGVALRMTKRLLADSFESDFDEALEREFTYQTICFTTKDAVEGAVSFLERREPRFRSH